jgi:hypothetical protein
MAPNLPWSFFQKLSSVFFVHSDEAAGPLKSGLLLFALVRRRWVLLYCEHLVFGYLLPHA